MISAAYEVSKFLTLPMLLLPSELEDLWAHLGKVEIFDISRITSSQDSLAFGQLREWMEEYDQSLLGKQKIRSLGALALTRDRNALSMQQISEERWIIKPCLPVVTMREHTFIYGEDKRFHSHIHGEKAIRWGIELSFPQLFVDGESRQVHHTLKEPQFVNAEVFRRAMQWMRRQTRPVPFEINGVKKWATFRIGLQAWERETPMYDLEASGLKLAPREQL